MKIFKEILKTFAFAFVISAFLTSGYIFFKFIVFEELGLVTKEINIVGTGSMYPTWPKGTKGKDHKELANEIVSTAGFLPYPNGLTINGYKLFGHTLNRGDIITWENEATRELTSRDGAEPAGLLKRIIGIKGDAIEIKDGVLYLNGEAQKEGYTAKPRSTFGEEFLRECQVVTVPDNYVFALGDNRKGSADSREIGFVPIADITKVLPYEKQLGNVDTNWREPSNDLDDLSKPKVDKQKFLELLNNIRKEEGATPLKYQPLLEKSAILRGQSILKNSDFKQKKYTMERSMADAGYWNSLWWEVPIQGYYEAEELIEDYLERDWSEARETWFDNRFDEIGIAEVQGSLDGCPTQIIVIHVAGYVPAVYQKETVESWRETVNNLKLSISSWETAKDKNWVDENDLSKLLDLLGKQKNISVHILSKMERKEWLTKTDDNLIEDFKRMNKESNSLAKKLNSKY